MTITIKVCERTKQEMNEFFEDFKSLGGKADVITDR